MSLGQLFWTDPRTTEYGFGDKLPNDDVDAYRTALKNLDLVVEKLMAQNWVYRAQPLGPQTSTTVAYSGPIGCYALVGTSGSVPSIHTSPGEYTWTPRTVPAGTATTLQSIVCAATSSGPLVAGADDGTTRRSTDGSTWTAYSTGSSAPIGLFWDSTNSLVITHEAGRGSAYSDTTGLAWVWNASALPSGFSSATATAGCHGNGINVVTGSTLSVSAYSSDGINWSQGAMPVVGAWGSGLCYAEKLGKFFATDSAVAGRTAYSTNGSTWTTVSGITRPSSQTLSMIQSCGNILVARGGATLVMMSDDEGANWRTVGAGASTITDIRFVQDDTDTGGRFLFVVGSVPEVTFGLRVQL